MDKWVCSRSIFSPYGIGFFTWGLMTMKDGLSLLQLHYSSLKALNRSTN